MKKLLVYLLIQTAACINTRAQSWQTLQSGLDGTVNALINYNGQMVAGGNFLIPGLPYNKYIAAWDGTAWDTLGCRMTNIGQCNALCNYNGNLVAGGSFIGLGKNKIPFLALWNGTSWDSTGKGIYGWVNALTVYNGNLIAGGFLDSAGGIAVNKIASWNGSAWDSLGAGISGQVFALCVYNGNLVAGGIFDSAGGKPAKNIAIWNGTNWSALGTGVNNEIYTLTVYNGNLIAGGAFDSAGGKPAMHIAQWNGTSWLSFSQPISYWGGVDAMTIHNGNLIVGGEFDSAGVLPANNIAQWDGSNWSVFGSGFYGHEPGPIYVAALDIYDSNLYAGGYLDSASGKAVNNIAEWCINCPSDISEVSNKLSTNVYPNPNNGSFTLQVNSDKRIVNSVVEIYNTLGEKVYSKQLTMNNGQLTMNLNDEPSGVYLYKIVSGNGNTLSVGKFVIEK